MVTFAPVDSGFDTSTVVLQDGTRLHYAYGGPAGGPAVIFLHGVADSSFSFSRVFPLMPDGFRLLALDQRGHGESGRPDTAYDIDDFAGDVLGIMNALQIATATVVGHSMGSFVARRVAERAPERVSRLVLIGTALTPRNGVMADLRQAVQSLTDPVEEAFIREFQLGTIARPVPGEFMKRVVRESQKLPARVWRAAFDGMWRFEPRWPLTCPTMILGGDRDAVFSVEEQSALFTSTERSTLHVEAGAGHALHWEDPERFVALAFSTR